MNATHATVSLAHQAAASAEIYKAALEQYGSLPAADLERVLGIASDSTVARVATLRDIRIPVILDIDKRMLDVVMQDKLDMRRWHCGTTHCRAGWSVVFGGAAGEALERAVGTEMAGRLIYEASTGRVAPDFYASTEEAIADIKRCAELAPT